MNDRLRENFRSTYALHDQSNPTPSGTGKNCLSLNSRKSIRQSARTLIFSFLAKVKQEYVQLNAHQRITAFVLCSILIATVGIQSVQPFLTEKAYALSAPVTKLIGDSRDDTKQFLKLNQDKTAFEFKAPDTTDPNTKHVGRNPAVYTTSLSTDSTKGITYTDTATKIDITVVPKFYTATGKKATGDSIVYPAGADQLIYTHKYNGLKEDIIVPSYRADKLNYSFELSIPNGAEARTDKQGNIEIYSADPTLFGNISFGSDNDHSRIDKAREKSVKNNLIARIPSPIIKDASGIEHNDLASFTLSKLKTVINKDETTTKPDQLSKKLSTQAKINVYKLNIMASTFKNLHYPISIDPTIETQTASDFQKGDVSGVDVDTTSSLIKRSPLTGGTTTFQSTASFDATGREGAGVVVSKGYIYVVGGQANGSTNVATVRYAAIDSAGAVGTWNNGLSLSGARGNACTVAMNGYIYTMGGTNGSNAGVNTVEYTKVNDNGTLKGWSISSQTLGAGYLYNEACTTYNNNIYAIGGFNGATISNTMYTAVKGDGDIAGWIGSSALTTLRNSAGATAYNGVLYVAGGHSKSAGGTFGTADILTSVEAAKINSDGSLSGFSVVANMTVKRFSPVVVSMDGYIYFYSGCSAVTITSCSAYDSTVDYSEIYADGTITAPKTSVDFVSTGRALAAGAAYNNNLYVVGGCTNLTSTTQSCSATLTDARRATIDQAGVLDSAWRNSSSFTTARNGQAVVAYNGYIYVAGGCINGCTANTADGLDDVQYAPINNDGTVGTWATTTVLPTTLGYTGKRTLHSMNAYNGYMYLMGGSKYTNLNVHVANTDVFYAPIAANGTIGAWTATSQFAGVRQNQQAVAYNGYLYVLGGYDGNGNSALLNDVQYAAFNANGTLAAWATTTNLPAGMNGFGVKAYQGKLIIVAGVGGTGTANTTLNGIYEISINGNGTLAASWTADAVSSPLGGRLTIAIEKDILYIYNSSSALVYYAQLTTSATISGSFIQTTGQNFGAVNGFGFQGIAYNGNLYHLGDGTNVVHYIHINYGGPGTLSSWTAPQSLAAARSYGGSATANGYLYYVGGCSGTNCGSGVSTTVQYTHVQSDGSLASPWTSATNSLPAARAQEGVVVVGNTLYVMGGWLNNTTSVKTVYYSVLDPTTGAPGAWNTSTSYDLLAARRGMAAVAYAGYIYVIGGEAGTNTLTTEYTQVGSSGGVPTDPGCGTAWCATTSLPTGAGTLLGSAAVNGSTVYFEGGQNAAATAFVPDTYYASLSSSGIGTWTKSPNQFYNARYGHVSFIINGILYVIGGDGTLESCSSSVQYAPLLSDGSVGLWQTTERTTTGRTGASGAYANGGIYFMGGQSCGAPLTTVNRASVQSIDRSGTYSRLLDFDKGVLPSKLITRGTVLINANVSLSYTSSNNLSTTLDSAQSVSRVGYDGANATTLSLGSTRSLARYLYMTYTFDDSQTSNFPDSNQTTITDYDLYFRASAGLRLRGGNTFTTQIERGLDAQ